MTDFEIVRDACVRANPVTMPAAGECAYCKGQVCYCPERTLEGSWKSAGRPIRLADVVLAIKSSDPSKMTVGRFKELCGDVCSRWNLRTDNLSQQSAETLKFLASLLRVRDSSSPI